jgi:hypothetical protein
MYGGVDVQINVFLTFALDGGELLGVLNKTLQHAA